MVIGCTKEALFRGVEIETGVIQRAGDRTLERLL